MKYWVIADLHLGHKKCEEFCNRPIAFEDKILHNLARTCRKDDVIIVLGDVCIGHDAYWHGLFCAYCASRKWLVRGNHDSKSYSWYLTHGWDMACESLELMMFGRDILLSHKPIADCGYNVNIHGHFHNSDHRRHEPDLVAVKNDKQVLVMCEHDYMPYDLQKLCERIK